MSNLLFPRRYIQNVISRLEHVVEQDQLSAIVNNLNKPGAERLHFMWEVIWLDVLSRGSALMYEQPLDDGRKPDFRIELEDNDKRNITLIGDVRTVSDSGLDNRNPVDLLSDELIKLALKFNLNPDHFSYRVNGAREGRYGDQRVKLTLPEKNNLDEIIISHIKPWIKKLSSERINSDSFKIEQNGTDIEFHYNTSQRFHTRSHPSYDIAASRRKNPLFNTLKGKKKQFKSAPSNAIRVIIVCDGDCGLMKSSDNFQTHGTFSASEIAQDFLRQNTSIDYVLLTKTKEVHRTLQPREYELACELVSSPSRPRSSRVSDMTHQIVHSFLDRACRQLPRPVTNSATARSRSSVPGAGPDMIGGYEMANGIKISSRALQRLLSGEISSEDFLAQYDWLNGRTNPFASRLKEGRMIKEINVEPVDGKDDDWLSIKFGEPDAANGPFRIP